MRPSLFLLPLVLAATPASGQAFVRVSAGATFGTPFVKDFIAHPVEARQSLAPTGAVLVGWPIGHDVRLAAEARYARGNWQVDDDGTTDDIASLATLALALVADGPIGGGLRWEVAVGTLRYLPGEEIGLFANGGTARWLLGAGATWRSPVASTFELVVGARYDFHGFSTSALESAGYSRSQTVHRGGLTLGLERSF
jgi:hypothetical protein